jgi:hypothetical protein
MSQQKPSPPLEYTIQQKLKWIKSSTSQQVSLQCLAAGYSFENLKGSRSLNWKKTVFGILIQNNVAYSLGFPLQIIHSGKPVHIQPNCGDYFIHIYYWKLLLGSVAVVSILLLK